MVIGEKEPNMITPSDTSLPEANAKDGRVYMLIKDRLTTQCVTKKRHNKQYLG